METVAKDYYIQLDTKYKITGESIKLVQSDNNGNLFHFTLTENDEPINLTGATVSITLLKADGKVLVNYCNITDAINGMCDYMVDTQALTYIGQVIYSVEIYANGGRVTTNQAKFKVVAELDDGSAAPSDGNYNILADLIEEVNTTENNIINNETIRQANEDVRISNENTRIDNENTRIANEDVRISNETTRVTEFAQIKEDYNTASKYTVVSSLEGSYIASEADTMTFILPIGVFNPLVDVVRLFYKGAFLSENLHYSRLGSEITLGFVIQKYEQIDFQIDKAVINEIPGADGGLLMEKSVKQMSLSEDVQAKLNYAGVKTIDGKFTATVDNTTVFTITENYNPTMNVLRLYYEGCYLEKGVSYTQIGAEITLTFPINIGEEINYQIERNVSVEVPQADGSNMMNDSIGIIKLTEDVRSKVNSISNKVDRNFVNFSFLPLLATSVNVGGECSLIQTKNKNILIDTGATDSYPLIKQYLIDKGVTKIDYLIITHYHSDHVGNLQNLISDFNFNNCIAYLCKKSVAFPLSYDTVVSLLSSNTKIYPNNGDIVEIDGVILKFFNCSQADIDYYDSLASNYNDFSMCFTATHDNTKVLYTGDICTTAQGRINGLGYFEKVDLLKVEHHGYDLTVNTDYLQTVNPKYGVISSRSDTYLGQNIKAHTTSVLNSLGAEVFIIGYDGAITFISDGNSIEPLQKNKSLKSFSQYDQSKYADIYVDCNTSVIDRNGTHYKPFKTVQEAVTSCSTLKGGKFIIKITDGTYDETVNIVNAQSSISLYGNPSNSAAVKITNINVYDSNVKLSYINITGKNNIPITLNNSRCRLTSCVIDGIPDSTLDAWAGRGICAYNSTVNVESCTVSNRTSAIFSCDGSIVTINGLSGINNQYLYLTGTGGQITVSSITATYTLKKFGNLDSSSNITGVDNNKFIQLFYDATASYGASSVITCSDNIINYRFLIFKFSTLATYVTVPVIPVSSTLRGSGINGYANGHQIHAFSGTYNEKQITITFAGQNTCTATTITTSNATVEYVYGIR